MVNSISTFTIIKNEAEFVGEHIMNLLDHVDEMVFADGNSTDGTIEIIEYIKKYYDKENKIKLFKDKDCKNLQDDYTDLFNWTLKQCTSKFVWFVHPDMITLNPEMIKKSLEPGIIRYSAKIKSIAGDRNKVFTKGRDDRWATIYSNSLGLHYYGWYGAVEEDLYFKAYTGDQHIFYKHMPYLPYEIKDTDIEVLHYCDTKDYKRRFERMVSVLKNVYKGLHESDIMDLAKSHPRVSLENGKFNGREFEFEPFHEVPEVFTKYGAEFEQIRKEHKNG